MEEYLGRFAEPHMGYYRRTYEESRKWAGESLKGKHVIVYMEQGIGDQIQFLRYIPILCDKGAKVTLHAPKELERLVRHLGYDFIEKENPELPAHDFHVPSLSLPFLLKDFKSPGFYITLYEKAEIPKGLNIGVAWEGNPDHPMNLVRSCPLKHFRPLLEEGVKLYHLQPGISLPNLVEGAEDIPLYGVGILDWYDTAKLINALDIVVSVDTGVLHLAGAMGKKTFGLLGPGEIDPRWKTGRWYDSVKLLAGNWDLCVSTVLCKSKK